MLLMYLYKKYGNFWVKNGNFWLKNGNLMVTGKISKLAIPV